MREILFKAKRKDNGEWVEGAYWPGASSNFNKPMILTGLWDADNFYACNGFEVDPATVCQYHPKTPYINQDLWEGDLLKTNGIDGELLWEFYFDGDSFRFIGVGHGYSWVHNEVHANGEFIRNIHDTPLSER